ncbi:MAG: hypothetical protein ABSA79_00425 [Candidatus Bathyarchaeia archaeon]|jgi:hypothetical protein
MSTEQFTVQAPYSVFITILVIILIAFGVVLMLSFFLDKLVRKLSSISLSGGKTGNRYVYATIGIVLIVLAGGLSYYWYAPSTVTVGSGYINIQFSALSPIPFIGGEKNVTSNEISNAFVGQIGSGAFTLNKQYGNNLGDTNIGVFTLGNGATAYMASTNSTDLIIQLKSGEYIILGTSNMSTLAASFSQNVYPLKSP